MIESVITRAGVRRDSWFDRGWTRFLGAVELEKSAITQSSIARYFSGSPGHSIESNFGMMCERAATLKRTHRSVKCRACGGGGFRELSAEELVLRWNRILEVEDKLQGEKNSERADDLLLQQEEFRKQLSRESDCKSCRGTGYTVERGARRNIEMDTMFTTVACKPCRSSGKARRRSAEARLILGDDCEVCQGAGCVVPVTVKETGSSKHGRAPKRLEGSDRMERVGAEGQVAVFDGDGPGAARQAQPTETDRAASWVDEDEMTEYGRVSRVIEAIRRSDPLIALAIEVFNGTDGDEWGRHRWGRLFSLWALTEAGQRLAVEGAERSGAAHGLKIRPLDLIAAERDAEMRSTEPDHTRRALISLADKQARSLHEDMERALSDAAEEA
jgi:hypothetical protein